MADKKITELTNITGANLVDADEFVVVDISADETKAITLGELKEAFDSGSGFVRITGDTMTGDLALSGADVTFGDNDKAIFGAGSDLQIYHDGSHSYISDQGTGRLKIFATDLEINNAGNTANYIQAFDGGAVQLFYNNQNKLATTSTGIDVTGTVTADGLTVDGDARIEEIGAIAKLTLERGGTANSADSAAVDMLETNAGSEGANFGDAGTNGFRLKLDGSANDFLIQSATATTIRTRLGVDRDTGDISFYEDTGTTAKFFWDASAESLGIGTSSPTAALDVRRVDADGAIAEFHQSGGYGFKLSSSQAVASIESGYLQDFVFKTGSTATERMRIDSSGKVGIGTNSPSSFAANASNLVVGSGSGTEGVTVYSGSSNYGVIYFADGTSGSSAYAGNINYNHADNSMRLGTNGSTTDVVIDSSGNVGIGTTSPGMTLDVNGSSGPNDIVRFSGPNSGGITFRNSTSNELVMHTATSDALIFGTNGNNERMRIDASGNVGIGTSNPTSPLSVGGDSPQNLKPTVNIKDESAGASLSLRGGSPRLFMDAMAGGVPKILMDGQGIEFKDGTLDSEGTVDLKLDSSGNLLLGKTSADNGGTVGAEINTNDTAYFTRSAGAGVVVNRLSSDGNIAVFQKDGSTVGSIGTESGSGFDAMYIANGDAGLIFQGYANDAIIPFDGSTLDKRDAAIDLGYSAGRFKDLYLSSSIKITGSGDKSISLTSGTGSTSIINMGDADDIDVGQIVYDNANNSMQFKTNASERMRIDSSGNLLVGKTVQSIGTVGVTLVSGQVTATADGADAIRLNRKTSDGSIIDLRKDGSTVGSIGVRSGDILYVATSDNAGQKYDGDNQRIDPCNSDGSTNDNSLDLGGSSSRFDDIYATNGSIQTSDRNEKQDIEALSDAEQRVAVACKGLLRKFRWIGAVAEKGDDARIHFGIIAQDLQDAFAAEGLDAGRYAMFISSTWWEATETYTDDDGVEQTRVNTYETLEEAPEGATERTRLGVRYPELLAFIIAAI